MKIEDISFEKGYVAYQPWGTWCWFLTKPNLTDNGWYDCDGVFVNLSFIKIDSVKDWKQSLIKVTPLKVVKKDSSDIKPFKINKRGYYRTKSGLLAKIYMFNFSGEQVAGEIIGGSRFNTNALGIECHEWNVDGTICEDNHDLDIVSKEDFE